jgi:hypothetical protein
LCWCHPGTLPRLQLCLDFWSQLWSWSRSPWWIGCGEHANSLGRKAKSYKRFHYIMWGGIPWPILT